MPKIAKPIPKTFAEGLPRLYDPEEGKYLKESVVAEIMQARADYESGKDPGISLEEIMKKYNIK